MSLITDADLENTYKQSFEAQLKNNQVDKAYYRSTSTIELQPTVI